jgi:hypothetical protein
MLEAPDGMCRWPRSAELAEGPKDVVEPAAGDLVTLIAMGDTDEVVRLRLLRAIRDLGV